MTNTGHVLWVGAVALSSVNVWTTVTPSAAYKVKAVPTNFHAPNPWALAALRQSATVLARLPVRGTGVVNENSTVTAVPSQLIVPPASVGSLSAGPPPACWSSTALYVPAGTAGIDAVKYPDAPCSAAAIG